MTLLFLIRKCLFSKTATSEEGRRLVKSDQRHFLYFGPSDTIYSFPKLAIEVFFCLDLGSWTIVLKFSCVYWNRASLTKLFGHQFNQDLSSLTIFILTWYHRFIAKQGWCWFPISCLISIKDSKYFFSLPVLHISLQNCVSYVSIECRHIFVGWIDVKR